MPGSGHRSRSGNNRKIANKPLVKHGLSKQIRDRSGWESPCKSSTPSKTRLISTLLGFYRETRLAGIEALRNRETRHVLPLPCECQGRPPRPGIPAIRSAKTAKTVAVIHSRRTFPTKQSRRMGGRTGFRGCCDRMASEFGIVMGFEKKGGCMRGLRVVRR